MAVLVGDRDTPAARLSAARAGLALAAVVLGLPDGSSQSTRDDLRAGLRALAESAAGTPRLREVASLVSISLLDSNEPARVNDLLRALVESRGAASAAESKGSVNSGGSDALPPLGQSMPEAARSAPPEGSRPPRWIPLDECLRRTNLGAYLPGDAIPEPPPLARFAGEEIRRFLPIRCLDGPNIAEDGAPPFWIIFREPADNPRQLESYLTCWAKLVPCLLEIAQTGSAGGVPFLIGRDSPETRLAAARAGIALAALVLAANEGHRRYSREEVRAALQALARSTAATQALRQIASELALGVLDVREPEAARGVLRQLLASGGISTREVVEVDREKRSPADLKGTIDFAVITIKEEELGAVLDQFNLSEPDLIRGARAYAVARIRQLTGDYATVAITRCPSQGNGVAQDVARDIIDELDPQWLLVVGIAGGLPASEFSLGDVVLASQVLDFSVEAVKAGRPPTFAVEGRVIHQEVENYVTMLRAHAGRLGKWNELTTTLPEGGRVALELPRVDLSAANFYGSSEWQAAAKESLTRYTERSLKRPIAVAVPIGSSDRLIKNDEIIAVWTQVARQVRAVEMESAGVHIAARGRAPSRKDYPVLSIRGISDIIGFKRDEGWTRYACESAAAFANAFVRSGYVEPRSTRTASPPPPSPGSRQAPPTATVPKITITVLAPLEVRVELADAHPFGLSYRDGFRDFPAIQFRVRVGCAPNGPNADRCFVRAFVGTEDLLVLPDTEIYAGDEKDVAVALLFGTRQRLLLSYSRTTRRVAPGGDLSLKIVARSANGGCAEGTVTIPLRPTYEPVLTPDGRKLLIALLEHIHAKNSVPERNRFRIEHQEQLAVLNELERDGWIHDLWGRYYLTPKGWVACKTPAAEADCRAAEKLIQDLNKVYSDTQDPIWKQWSWKDLAAATGGDPPAVARALLLMLTADLLDDAYPDNNDGLVGRCRLKEKFLLPEPLIGEFRRVAGLDSETPTGGPDAIRPNELSRPKPDPP